MYIALLLILLGLSGFLFLTGARKRQPLKKYSGIVLALLSLFFFWFMNFWGEVLWFESLGYGGRFWKILNANFMFAVAGAFYGLLVMYLLTLGIKKHQFIKKVTWITASVIGAFWGDSNWENILKYWYSEPTGLNDPILGTDVSFYLFALPFYDSLIGITISLIIISIIAVVISMFIRLVENKIIFFIPQQNETFLKTFHFPLYLNVSILIFVIAIERFFSRYHLMYSTTGVAAGMSWTDVNILLPATIAVIILLVLIGVALLVPNIRKVLQRFLFRRLRFSPDWSNLSVIISSGVFIIAIWIIAFGILPKAFNWLMVEPNEITFERPYILHNIEFTRHGFGLNNVEVKEYEMDGTLNQESINQSPELFSNIRLWDPKALDATYKQFQAMRLYYEFSDIDVDRYTIDGKSRQVMVSAREINIDNLPAQSQTFVNKRFQYTHGYGVTMSGVSEFTPEGLPYLIIKDIPPVSQYPSLEVKRPQIYFGEMTNTHVIVKSKAKEFDYPSGEENVYTQYAGKGGVEISNFWRKFLYGWKFDGTNLLFSDYPTSESRLMFHRQIEERVKMLAPFLHFDEDPYIVLSNGQLYWMIDAYTTSEYFPYSQPFSATENIQLTEGNSTKTISNQVSGYLEGVNYIRNSVKAVVNAYDGSVDFYIMDNKDPIIKVWSKILPDLFKQKNEMPADLLNHLRYPVDMLLTQGLVYQKYHMTDPTVFYNQEDLWVRATSKYYNETQPVDPYYIMWQQPGSKEQEFILMSPFTPKNRQVLIGWIAGKCDAENYGQFVAYQFSKDKMVLGPQQVESKIDQDSFLSGQLTLWDQRGSKVIRGNVLAIPVDNTLLYVEPIYLQSETAAYPELRLVVVMHGDNMNYAKSFDEALNGLFSRTPVQQKVTSGETTTNTKTETKTSVTGSPNQVQIKAANDAFNNYLRLTAEKRFTEAAKELERLQQALQNLTNQGK